MFVIIEMIGLRTRFCHAACLVRNRGRRFDHSSKFFDPQVLDMLLEDTTDITTGDSIADEDESFEEKPFRVRGCFLSAVERLDEEFTKVNLTRPGQF